jgi:hypothetical protein
MKPTPGGKACGFPALRGLSAAPLGIRMKYKLHAIKNKTIPIFTGEN